MTDFEKLYQEKKHTIPEVLASIHSGDVIFTTNNYSEPGEILSHLHEIAPHVENVKVWKGRSGLYPFMVDPAMRGHIEMYNYFFGPTFYKNSLPMGLVEYVPSDLQSYYTVAVSGHPSNVAIAAVTPMDENGDFHVPMNHAADGLGMLAAVEQHQRIILEVNPNLKHMHGAAAINIRDVDMLVEVNRPQYVIPNMESTETEKKIGEAVASLVHDGDTIQLGIGGIPNAVGSFLTNKQDLGIHSEMFTSCMMDLINAGVITGKKKTFDRGLHVCAGQVCAESIGPQQISGSGGAFCCAYGTYRSKGGRSILAFPARSGKGHSKIKATLTPGAVVTTPRNYVDYIVTEFGIAQLKGKTIRERAQQLISIAHPDDRAKLRRQAKMLHYI